MALFEDSFTEASDVNLEDHAPDIGTAWTLISGVADGAQVESTDNTLRSGSNTLTFTASDDLGVSDLSVEGTLGELVVHMGKHVALRVQDSSNFIGWIAAGTGGSGMRLVKVIAGVTTNLIQIQPVLGRTYRVEAEGTTVKFFENGIQQGSDVTVTEFSSETRQGVITSSGERFEVWLTDYKADSLAVSGVSIPVIMNHLRNQGIS